jgi:hypothetical protein
VKREDHYCCFLVCDFDQPGNLTINGLIDFFDCRSDRAQLLEVTVQEEFVVGLNRLPKTVRRFMGFSEDEPRDQICFASASTRRDRREALRPPDNLWRAFADFCNHYTPTQGRARARTPGAPFLS